MSDFCSHLRLEHKKASRVSLQPTVVASPRAGWGVEAWTTRFEAALMKKVTFVFMRCVGLTMKDLVLLGEFLDNSVCSASKKSLLKPLDLHLLTTKIKMRDQSPNQISEILPRPPSSPHFFARWAPTPPAPPLVAASIRTIARRRTTS